MGDNNSQAEQNGKQLESSQFTRRQFLKTAALTGGGLALAAKFGLLAKAANFFFGGESGQDTGNFSGAFVEITKPDTIQNFQKTIGNDYPPKEVGPFGIQLTNNQSGVRETLELFALPARVEGLPTINDLPVVYLRKDQEYVLLKAGNWGDEKGNFTYWQLPNDDGPSLIRQYAKGGKFEINLPSENKVGYTGHDNPPQIDAGTLPEKAKDILVKRKIIRRGPETLAAIPNHVLVLDFAPEIAGEGVIQKIVLSNKDTLKKLFGDPNFDLDQARSQTNLEETNPHAALLLRYFDLFKDHGKNVTTVLKSVWEKLGFMGTPTLHPLQEILGSQQVKWDKDELDNQRVNITVEPEPIINILRQYPEQKIVNFSFQVGTMSVTLAKRTKEYPPSPIAVEATDPNGNKVVYPFAVSEVTVNSQKSYLDATGQEVTTPVSLDAWEEMRKDYVEKHFKIIDKEHPSYEVTDAYVEERAVENLKKLFTICQTFPDRLFFAAGGNYADNIIKARSFLKDRWPSNLRLTAAYNVDLLSGKPEFPDSRVYGMDVYVGNEYLGLANASSFTTPVITGSAAIAESQGKTQNEILQTITSFCDPVTYFAGKSGEQDTRLILNPKKIKF